MRLYLGDCFDIIKDIDLKSDYIFTSPPYNRKRNDKYNNYNDTIDDYFKFLCEFMTLVEGRYTKFLFLNIQSNFYNKKDVWKFFGEYSDILQQLFIWEKTNPLPSPGFQITNSYEFFMVFGKESLKSNTTYTKNIISTSINTQTTTKIHKAVMKQEVADWFIEKFTQEKESILDPFMGLGTTAISCMKYNRFFMGVEKDREYYLLAKNRIRNSIKELHR